MSLPPEVTSDPNYCPEPADAPREVTVLEGCIRLDPSGPYAHVNAGHHLVGLTGLWIDSAGQLVLDHASAGPCASILVSPDETLAGERGVTAGGSGGGVQTRIRFHHPSIPGRRLYLNRPAEWDLVAGETSNVWVKVTHRVAPEV